MSFLQALFLFFIATLSGALNAVAGGGSFFTVPALIFTNVQPTIANATSTIALLPGSLASTSAYRHELATQNRPLLTLLIIMSLLGGILGALLLLNTPQNTFVHLLPFLLLFATLLFIFSGPITARLRKRASHEQKQRSTKALVGIAIMQLCIAIYGGYFGGGGSIIMLAALAVMGMEDMHLMNSTKTLLISCMNIVAVITFIIAGVILWPQTLVMMVGAAAGGYGGAYYARKIDQKWIRMFVAIVGICMSIAFFIRS